VKRLRRSRAVRIHVADQVGDGGELQSFDERAALANRIGKVEKTDARKFLRHLLYDTERVVAAAVEHHEKFEASWKFTRVVFGKVAQHRPDARLLVVSGDEQQQAVLWFVHVGSSRGNETPPSDSRFR